MVLHLQILEIILSVLITRPDYFRHILSGSLTLLKNGIRGATHPNCNRSTTYKKLYLGHNALTKIVSGALRTQPNCIQGATHSPKLYLGRQSTHPNCIWGVTHSPKLYLGHYSLTQIVSGALNIHQISNWGAANSPKLFLGGNGNSLIGFLSETLVFCKKLANERFFFKKKSNSLI